TAGREAGRDRVRPPHRLRALGGHGGAGAVVRVRRPLLPDHHHRKLLAGVRARRQRAPREAGDRDVSGRTVRWLMSLAHRPRSAAEGASLTIVRHHRVYAESERPLYRLGVSTRVLEQQLALLARHGLAPLTVSEGLTRLASERRGRWVAMTFDDGYEDNVTRALPLLQRHGAHATFYLTAGLMERRVAPWWDRLTHALEQARVASARVE